ncbi:adenine-specific methyltransferase EcoRI family protein [Neisseria leonii]|uniref:Adenine-specific methyltransferase EcoRI family protein n=1 Tax=Neisseria leonii TaxID=2995413 RepID=A0A9X4E1I2_9NEIS|nr:adenine-specific methyltransferase EcoRI family protein [Neisseria sp. 51.81]MDD9327404.1 adenine-specific methyltransferase EcoRI family protein [Neisseria sp. 51.81]
MSDAAKNSNLSAAKKAKNDEFYTQFHDIEKEMNAYLDFDEHVFRGKTVLLPCDDPEWSNFTKYFAQNFTRLGLKKLISTSYAHASKQLDSDYQPSLFECENTQFDAQKSAQRGKIFTLTQDTNSDGIIDLHDVEWRYLQGDGDFRSDEVKALRDEADIIVTNPPFSLFREFLAWIVEADKRFAIVANKNCVTYKEVFPLIKENKIWSGRTEWSGGMWFETKYDDIDKVIDGTNMKNVSSIWITNLEHGRRHQPLQLMTMEDNRKFNKQIIKSQTAYLPYDNYHAIEVPFTNAIPSDYDGVMGVPISFLDKYNPEQFEILGATESEGRGFSNGLWDENSKVAQPLLNRGRIYKRLFIRHKGEKS